MKLASNFLGNIWLDHDDLELEGFELLALLLHEAEHSRQLFNSFFDARRFSKAGRQSLELDCTMRACHELGALGFGVKDFLRVELSRYIRSKYNVSLEEFIRRCKGVKMSR